MESIPELFRLNGLDIKLKPLVETRHSMYFGRAPIFSRHFARELGPLVLPMNNKLLISLTSLRLPSFTLPIGGHPIQLKEGDRMEGKLVTRSHVLFAPVCLVRTCDGGSHGRFAIGVVNFDRILVDIEIAGVIHLHTRAVEVANINNVRLQR